jgi:hypothetical protein
MDRLKKDFFLILLGGAGVVLVVIWALGSF